MSATVCPNCGAPLAAGAKTCARCGRAVPAPLIPSGASVRRRVPVVPLLVLGAGVLALVVVMGLVRENPPAGEVLSSTGVPTSAPSPARPEAVEHEAVASPVPAAPPVVTEPAADVVPAIQDMPKRQPTATPPIEKTYECREGAIFGVDPEEALVAVDGTTIGTADDWDDAGGGGKYRFAGPGTHYVRLSLPGYRTAWVKIVVRAGAEEEYAEVDLELEKLET
jgi:hypothetical protein